MLMRPGELPMSSTFKSSSRIVRDSCSPLGGFSDILLDVGGKLADTADELLPMLENRAWSAVWRHKSISRTDIHLLCSVTHSTMTPTHVRLCTAMFPLVFFRLGEMFMAGVHAAISLLARLRRRTDGLLAGLREALLNYPMAWAARVRIPMASLSDEQLALRALHARLSAQAQWVAFDEPDGTTPGSGMLDALMEAFIAFVPTQTAE